MFDDIKDENDYNKLLASGMFWEFYPELSGVWELDKIVIFCHKPTSHEPNAEGDAK